MGEYSACKEDGLDIGNLRTRKLNGEPAQRSSLPATDSFISVRSLLRPVRQPRSGAHQTGRPADSSTTVPSALAASPRQPWASADWPPQCPRLFSSASTIASCIDRRITPSIIGSSLPARFRGRNWIAGAPVKYLVSMDRRRGVPALDFSGPPPESDCANAEHVEVSSTKLSAATLHPEPGAQSCIGRHRSLSHLAVC